MTFLEFFSQGGWAEKSAQTTKKSLKFFLAWKVKNGFVRRLLQKTTNRRRAQNGFDEQ
jgi:hypothetical protein